MECIEGIESEGQVVIQHDVPDVEKPPPFPASAKSFLREFAVGRGSSKAEAHPK
jgi:hypothetical protein